VVVTYPFFRPPGAPWTWDYLLFELMYCLQFFAVEYFFRGVLTLGLKPTLGRSSVLIMLTPYCMLHFHKPLPEALGAIGAGWLLGILAWRTETVIWGCGRHSGVPLTMNMLGLMARGGMRIAVWQRHKKGALKHGCEGVRERLVPWQGWGVVPIGCTPWRTVLPRFSACRARRGALDGGALHVMLALCRRS